MKKLKVTSTRLMSDPDGTSYKLIIKFGDIFKEKLFVGVGAYKRAKLFQDNIQQLQKGMRF